MPQDVHLRRLIKKMKIKHNIIPIFVPHVGCPHDCVFCNQKKITGVSTDMTKEEVDNTIKSYLKTIPETNQTLEVAFYGGSFTAIDRGVQRDFLEVANGYKKDGKIDKIRLSTRPDCIDREELEMLKENGVDTIELGVQSLDQDVLDASNRGHSRKDVEDAVSLIREFGFTLGLQMMLGLPKDTKEKSIATAKGLIAFKPDLVRIYPTLIVKETFLEESYMRAEYSPLSLEDAVEISSIILMMFDIENINVIRVGLQPTENICSESGEVVAGPFHPSFRQLVESRIYEIVLDEFLDTHKMSGDEISIELDKKEISNLVGQKSVNIKNIKEKYHFKKVKIHGIDLNENILFVIDREKKYRLDKIEYMVQYLKNSEILIV